MRGVHRWSLTMCWFWQPKYRPRLGCRHMPLVSGFSSSKAGSPQMPDHVASPPRPYFAPANVVSATAQKGPLCLPYVAPAQRRVGSASSLRGNGFFRLQQLWFASGTSPAYLRPGLAPDRMNRTSPLNAMCSAALIAEPVQIGTAAAGCQHLLRGSSAGICRKRCSHR